MMKAQKEKQTAAGPGKGGAKKADSGVRTSIHNWHV